MKVIVVRAKTDTERIAELEAEIEKLKTITRLLSDVEKVRLEKEINEFKDSLGIQSPSQAMVNGSWNKNPPTGVNSNLDWEPPCCRSEPKGMKFWY